MNLSQIELPISNEMKEFKIKLKSELLGRCVKWVRIFSLFRVVANDGGRTTGKRQITRL